jgi:hypothetical protein
MDVKATFSGKGRKAILAYLQRHSFVLSNWIWDILPGPVSSLFVCQFFNPSHTLSLSSHTLFSQPGSLFACGTIEIPIHQPLSPPHVLFVAL